MTFDALWVCKAMSEKAMNRFSIILTGMLLLLVQPASAVLTINGEPLPMADAIALAQESDPWLQASLLEQQAYLASSQAAATQPDPLVSMGFANLPTDTFDFDQEAMTQFKIGVSQQFARGETLSLSRERLELMGANEQHRRADRRALVEARVTGLWLDAYLAAESIRVIESDRSLFEYLVDVAQSSYATAFGRTRQQDLVRAQLELTRLDDRLVRLRQQADNAAARLGEWLGEAPIAVIAGQAGTDANAGEGVGATLPALPIIAPAQFLRDEPLDDAWLGSLLTQHPRLRSLDNGIAVEQSGIALAEQKYKPQWGINANYGYRDDDPVMGDRADFFSVGVTFDVPLFTDNRQDKAVQSAIARTEARRSDRVMLLRTLRAELDTQRANYLRLRQRRELYASQLLEQMQEQAEASLNAYTSNDGDFAEVVRARIAELNTRIDALAIDVELVRTAAQLNYYLNGASYYTLAETGASS
jgi:outer membrane protein TolC